jgi:uncharacterized protein YyaL (SSP411 family)
VNRLAGETSPYLLQHASNPVDWYPWGAEAFAAARQRNVPVLLSIGYSACHWCHVMERESFDDPATAQVMNGRFVSIKVDREERPDIDAVYMDAVVALTGHGGWPMTVFLTPDQRPFWGGTYFPPEPRMGMPSFRQVLESVAEAYRGRGDEVERQADQLTAAIGRATDVEAAGSLPPGLIDEALAALRQQFDPTHAGFGGAPKFPPSALLATLLELGERGDARPMALATLDAMMDGGIHDQLGGGFHRYAVDAIWLVPHFEKMLYDNALLARAYALSGEPRHADVARRALAYLDREMRLEGGGLASAQDADTEGHEGLTFTWTPAQVAAVLGEGDDAAAVCERFGITASGNFEGATVLSVVGEVSDGAGPAFADACDRLLAARATRPQPFRDDKALAGWNGLALAAYADAGRLLGDPALVARAVEIAAFIGTRLTDVDGRLHRVFRDGASKIPGFAEDYGAVAHGLIALHEATGDLAHLAEARRLTGLALSLFAAPGGAFFLSPADGERLVARRVDVDDNPAPSGSSLIASNLLRLGRIYGDAAWEMAAEAAVRAVQGVLGRAPQAFGHLLGVAHAVQMPSREIAVVGELADPRTAALRAVVDRHPRPGQVVVVADPADPLFDTVPLLAGRAPRDGVPAAFVCERFTCQRPVATPPELSALLV